MGARKTVFLVQVDGSMKVNSHCSVHLNALWWLILSTRDLLLCLLGSYVLLVFSLTLAPWGFPHPPTDVSMSLTTDTAMIYRHWCIQPRQHVFQWKTLTVPNSPEWPLTWTWLSRIGRLVDLAFKNLKTCIGRNLKSLRESDTRVQLKLVKHLKISLGK